MSYTSDTVMNAIDLALATERKANRFYLDSIGKIKNLEQRNVLGQLASLEQNHYEQLKALKNSLTSDKKYYIYKDSHRESSGDDKVKLIEIMNMAVESEERAFDALKKLADSVGDPVWKEKFRKLAEEERADRKILADELYNISNQEGVYHWGD